MEKMDNVVNIIKWEEMCFILRKKKESNKIGNYYK